MTLEEFAKWAATHCERFGIDPQRNAVSIRDMKDFLDKNKATMNEASQASADMAMSPPLRITEHLPRLKAAVYAARAKAVLAKAPEPIQTPEELAKAKREWDEFIAARKQRGRHLVRT